MTESQFHALQFVIDHGPVRMVSPAIGEGTTGRQWRIDARTARWLLERELIGRDALSRFIATATGRERIAAIIDTGRASTDVP